jgi:hypothetical protein
LEDRAGWQLIDNAPVNEDVELLTADGRGEPYRIPYPCKWTTASGWVSSAKGTWLPLIPLGWRPFRKHPMDIDRSSSQSGVVATTVLIERSGAAMSFPEQSVDPPPENGGAVRMGRWIVVGMVAMLVAAMLAYDYTRSPSTMANVAPSSTPSTTGAVPTSHKVNPVRSP